MKTRVITAICIIAVVLYPLLAGGIPLAILAFVVLSGGTYEWLRKESGFSTWGIYAVVACIAYIYAARWLLPAHPYVYVAAGILVMMAMPVFFDSFTVQDSWAMVTMSVFFILVWLAFETLCAEPRYIWTICLATYGSDTGAYFAGRALGRHKMNPRISPKKTWEGFAGGLLTGFLLSFVLSLFYGKGLNSLVNVLLCLLCPMVAEAGDLCFSTIKRSRRQKDFSNLLPGHGGILDRVDSLLYNIVLFGILFQLLG